MSATELIGIVAALPEELAPLRRRARARREIRGGGRYAIGSLGSRAVVLAITGDGPGRARQGIARLLAHYPIARLIVVGISGGLTPDLARGQILMIDEVRDAAGDAAVRLTLPPAHDSVPGTAVTVDAVVGEPAAKRALAAELGIDGPAAVDMETLVYVRAAEENAIPCCVIRCICDTANDELPQFLHGCQRPDGSIDRGRIVRHALRHPWVIRELLAWRRRVRVCAERLTSFVFELLQAPCPADSPRG